MKILTFAQYLALKAKGTKFNLVTCNDTIAVIKLKGGAK